MIRFVAGLALGLALGAGGMYLWQRPAPPTPPASAPVAASQPSAPEKGGKKKKKRAPGAGGSASPAGDPAGDPEPEPEEAAIVLGPDDLRPRAQGDTLSARPQSLDLADGTEARDLSQGDIDSGFRGASGALTRCINEARGAASLSGEVSFGIVVGPDGRVIKSRVEAPAYLIEEGLAGCARPVLAGIRFPAPGRDVVASKSYSLR